MPKTVILSTARTPFAKMGGALSSLDATELGGQAISAALERSEVDPDQVESVSYGQVLQAGQGQIPSRQAQIKGGIPKEVPSETVNKVCASGMRSVGLLDQAVRAGDLSVGVGGGMESMSNAPYLLPGARFGFRMGDVTAIDAMTHDGLTNPFTDKQMINEASEVGNELEITRPDLDRFAVRSHQLAAKATDEGRSPTRSSRSPSRARKEETTVETDEAIRPDTSIETLAKLKGIGGDDATHTAGNSPGVNDGAGAVVLASDEWAEANGKQVLARILAYGTIGDDYAYLARTPAKAAQVGAREDRQVRRGRRPLGDQRGLRLRRPQLAADARHRGGQRQRQRRRDRPRPPDRRLRRPHHRRPRPRAAPAAAAASAAPRSARAAARATRSYRGRSGAGAARGPRRLTAKRPHASRSLISALRAAIAHGLLGTEPRLRPSHWRPTASCGRRAAGRRRRWPSHRCNRPGTPGNVIDAFCSVSGVVLICVCPRAEAASAAPVAGP